MSRRSPWLVAATLCPLLCTLGWVEAAAGCSTCSSGDPTLSALGTEAPSADAVRVGVALNYRSESSGDPGVDQLELREYRAEVTLAWAPIDSVFLLVTVPWLERRTTDVSLSTRHTRGVGDIELRSKITLYRDRQFAPRYLLGAVLAVQLPTAPSLYDAEGRPLPFEAQTGGGALAPLVGWAYSARLWPWSGYCSADVRVPILARQHMKPGVAVRSTIALQRALTAAWSVRAAADALIEWRSVEAGALDRDSGGVSALLGGDVLVDMGGAFSLLVGARAPVFDARNGAQSIGPTSSLTLTRDW